jgi:adenosylcobinamide-GDP ribazoletransferase
MLAPFLLAVTFLTRLPVPQVKALAAAPSGTQLGAAVGFFPWVGALIGGLLWAFHALVEGSLVATLTGLGLVSISALISGGLHLDGLADLFDAAGGGRGDRARMLQIMRDPRIGAHGACALSLVLIGKVLASAELVQHGPTVALFVAPVFARMGASISICTFAYARPDGLGRSFHDHAHARHLVVAGLAAVLALALAGSALIVPAIVSLLATLSVAIWAQHRLGGLTGDVHGAAIEIAELALLIAATL